MERKEREKHGRVALRKESVDRNVRAKGSTVGGARSLSVRRAWIEMPQWSAWDYKRCVALRKESVDRNKWWGFPYIPLAKVALRKESVDRNCKASVAVVDASGRSP